MGHTYTKKVAVVYLMWHIVYFLCLKFPTLQSPEKLHIPRNQLKWNLLQMAFSPEIVTLSLGAECPGLCSARGPLLQCCNVLSGMLSMLAPQEPQGVCFR